MPESRLGVTAGRFERLYAVPQSMEPAFHWSEPSVLAQSGADSQNLAIHLGTHGDAHDPHPTPVELIADSPQTLSHLGPYAKG